MNILGRFKSDMIYKYTDKLVNLQLVNISRPCHRDVNNYKPRNIVMTDI